MSGIHALCLRRVSASPVGVVLAAGTIDVDSGEEGGEAGACRWSPDHPGLQRGAGHRPQDSEQPRAGLSAHLLEIVVVSDGSSDSTEALAASGGWARPPRLPGGPPGKTACINAVLPDLLGRSWSSPTPMPSSCPTHCGAGPSVPESRIGCVMGELRYAQEGSLNSSLGRDSTGATRISSRSGRAGSARPSWATAHLRHAQDALQDPSPGSGGGCGKSAAGPLGGCRVIFMRSARCWERPAATVREEFQRKARIITNQITSYLYGWRGFRRCRRGGFPDRLPQGPAVAGSLLPGGPARRDGGAARRAPTGRDTALQVLFYLAALGDGGWSRREAGASAAFPPYYFCAVNMASIKEWRTSRWAAPVVWEKAASTR